MFDTAKPSEMASVGVSHPRVEGVSKLTGGALYTGDLVLAGMLHAKVKKSPHARANILRIDTSKAESLSGVHAVLTGRELNYKLGLYVVDKDILAKGVIRHFGEAVAAVAADTVEIASRAVELIDVEYEVLPPVLDPMEAMTPEAPLVHPDLGDYSFVERPSPPNRAPTSPTSPRSGRATSRRASPRRSGSSSASTPTPRCNTSRSRPMSPSCSGRPATT